MAKIKKDLVSNFKDKAQKKEGGKSAKPASNLAPKAKNLPKNVEGKGKEQEKKKAGESKKLPVESYDLKGKKSKK